MAIHIDVTQLLHESKCTQLTLISGGKLLSMIEVILPFKGTDFLLII